MGYGVTGVDINAQIINQARKNAEEVNLGRRTEFIVGDIQDLASLERFGSFDAVIHGGVMEHFPSVESIRKSIAGQLRLAPYVIFDVPIRTDKNLDMFQRDEIFRNVWSAAEWMTDVLNSFDVRRWTEVLRPSQSITDDAVFIVARSE